MEKLELKHLAPYLPYELKLVNITYDPYLIFDIKNYDFKADLSLNLFEFQKPILKPISDLSLLIKDEFEKYHGIRNGKPNEEIINLFCEENGVDEIIENVILSSLPYECIEFMFKNHYDFFGLIDKGLAININTLKL